MKTWQKFLQIAFGTVVINGAMVDAARAFELKPRLNLEVEFENLPEIVVGSGGIRLESGPENFDLDEPGEFFDLEIDGFNVGKFGCYTEVGITNLFGGTSGEGCSFNHYLSFIDELGNDLIANLINDDGLLSVNAIFSRDVELPNHTLIVTVYGTFPDSVPAVPTPTAVLPILSGLLVASNRRSKKDC